MKIPGQTSHPSEKGFSLIELVIVCGILTILLWAVFDGVNVATQRSYAEMTKVDLTQEGREFIDEFERDLHQAGYPNCRMVSTAGVANNCPADYSVAAAYPVEQNSALAVGLVSVSNTQIIFEGDVDGDGLVDTVRYRLVDSAGAYPPAGTCPCTIQRSQMLKVNGTLPLAQPFTFSQELQNVVNSGVPAAGLPYGGGLLIAGNTAWGPTNTAYYAAIASFKDYPVFQAYDQNGFIVQLPQDVSTAGSTPILTCSVSSVNCIKSIRLTINLLADATTGVDLKTRTRPVTTLVGDARLVNN